MGGVIDAIGDLIDDVVAITTVSLSVIFAPVAVILASICDACEEFMSDQWEKVLGWVGITDQDVISVQVQDQKLMEGNEDFYKNLMTQVALEHQTTQKGIIDLMAIKSQGIRGSIQKYSRYGKETYIDGLPDTTINTIAVDKSIVDAQVQLDVGYDVTIQEIIVKVPKETEWVPYRMTYLYDMNQGSMEFIYQNDVWIMTGYYYDYSAGVYKVNAYLKSTPTTTAVVSIGNYTPNVGYVVKYIKDGTFDEYYWVYFLNSGNAILDKARNYLTDLDMLPIVELRRGSVNVNSNKNSTRYLQSKEILGFIGLDVDTLIDNLESNSAISNVVAAYIYFGAEIGSNNPLQAKMVYHTLEYLWYDPTIVSNEQHQIKVSEGNYNSSISWEKQDRIVGIRTNVPIGKYEGGIGSITIGSKKKYYGWVRKQETSDEYVEYRIWNVSAITIIKKEGMSDAVLRVLAPDNTIVMPISQFFLSKFSPIEQGRLFPEILRLATYAADIQHLKYYQTQAFFDLIKIVMYAVAVVVFIATWFSGGATTAAFIAAVENVVIGMAVGYALQLLLQQIDNPYLRAAVSALVVFLASYYNIFGAGAKNAITLTADMVTTAVTNYADAVGENISEQFSKLQKDAENFAKLLEDRQKELEDKQKESSAMVTVNEVAELTSMNTNSYIEGVDLKYYRAIQMQYDWNLTKSMEPMTKLYDYDLHYRLGVV